MKLHWGEALWTGLWSAVFSVTMLTSGPPDDVWTVRPPGPLSLVPLDSLQTSKVIAGLQCEHISLCVSMIFCVYLSVCQAKVLLCQIDSLQQLRTSDWATMTRGNLIHSLPLSLLYTHISLPVPLVHTQQKHIHMWSLCPFSYSITILTEHKSTHFQMMLF